MTRPNVGDFLTETLVTDTRVWEVVKVTPRTLTIRATRRTAVPGVLDTACDHSGSGLGVYWHAVESNPTGRTRVVRLRRDWTYRVASWAHPLLPVKGAPHERVDRRR